MLFLSWPCTFLGFEPWTPWTMLNNREVAIVGYMREIYIQGFKDIYPQNQLRNYMFQSKFAQALSRFGW